MTQENIAGYVADYCLTTLANGEKKRMDQLHKGDRVKVMYGKIATIICVIETQLNEQTVEMVRMPKGLTVLPNHPVWEHNSTEWEYPIDLYDDCLSTKKPNSIFAFVLDKYHAMVVNEVSVICWGHAFHDDELANHPYFGNRDALLRDLSQLPGWSEGHIVLRPGALLLDPQTSQVCGIDREFCIGRE